MNIILKELTDIKNNIFQSEIWQKYYESLGHKCFFLNFNGENILITKMPLYKGKSYLYCPRGPLCSNESWHLFVLKLEKIAKDEDCVFVRVEPFVVPNDVLRSLKFKKTNKFSPLSNQHSPNATQILEIGKSEESLLSEMKPKCRYNIRLASKRGVVVRKSKEEADLKNFYNLSMGLKKRGYTGFDYSHYEKMLASLGENIIMFVAEYEKKVLAVLIIIVYGKTAVYLHGASSDNKRELMPSHLAQWEAILEAKKLGCTIYDFWGITEKGAENTDWEGITRFKKGFGGEPVVFLGSYDRIFQNFWYNLFYLFNFMRKVFKR
jgi:lipid II:glycine glycyltransferase (peptidoglycan interpeptide bridge formation enzyme)